MSEPTCAGLTPDHEPVERLLAVAVSLLALMVLATAFDGRNGITRRATLDRHTDRASIASPTMPELIAEMLSHD